MEVNPIFRRDLLLKEMPISIMDPVIYFLIRWIIRLLERGVLRLIATRSMMAELSEPS